MVHVVCPECGVANRSPRDRLAREPNVGSAVRRSFSGVPVDLDEWQIVRHIECSGLPLVADFWVPWCGPCRMMAPAFEAATQVL